MPKALRPFFHHDRRLFADVSRLIYRILDQFYHEAAGRTLLTGAGIAQQTLHLEALRLQSGCRAEQQPEAATRLAKIGRSPSGFDLDRLN